MNYYFHAKAYGYVWLTGALVGDHSYQKQLLLKPLANVKRWNCLISVNVCDSK